MRHLKGALQTLWQLLRNGPWGKGSPTPLRVDRHTLATTGNDEDALDNYASALADRKADIAYFAQRKAS